MAGEEFASGQANRETESHRFKSWEETFHPTSSLYGTPPKTNMERKNWWFVDVSPFPKG